MVFTQLWPNNHKASDPITSGGFIQAHNCLIWCSTSYKPFGNVIVNPVFGINYPQNLRLLSMRGPRSPEARPSQHYIGPKFAFCHLSNFCRKKVFGLDNKTPAHFYATLWLVICKNHVGKPLNAFKKCRKFLLSSLETFFCRNLKNVGISFLGRCNVETVSHPSL